MKIRTKNKSYTVEVVRSGDIGKFEVTPMDVDETNKLLKKYTKYEKAKGQVMPETDYFGFTLAKVRQVITGWNLTDESDRPLECNDENKKTAYILNPDIINEVIEQADKIASGNEEIKEVELKN